MTYLGQTGPRSWKRLLLQHLDNLQYILLFDELDEDYKEIMEPARNSLYLSLLTSLFKTIQDIRAIFPTRRYPVFPIVFLRDDIFELLSDSDRTKWYDLRIDLNWQIQKLQNLLAFRLSRSADEHGTIFPFDQAWHLVFQRALVGFGNMQKKKMATFDYITRSTHLRPRDYIRYIQACAEEALLRDENQITPAIVKFTDVLQLFAK